MTAEPVPVNPPPHPLYALTTYELRDYRRDLEHAPAARSGQPGAVGSLRQRLADVVAEQESRAKITTGLA